MSLLGSYDKSIWKVYIYGNIYSFKNMINDNLSFNASLLYVRIKENENNWEIY